MSNTLFKIDAIVVAGQAIAIEDGTATLTGAARFQNTVVPSASGDDFQTRARVPTTLHCKIQFASTVNPSDYSGLSDVQITARDTHSKRRALMPKCSFGEMGEIGGGSVDVTFNVLAPIQWL
ncbi:MAG: hypothetical protein QM617_09185 [Comamonas sp.]